MEHSQTIEVRNVKFAVDEQIPRAWHGGSRSVTAFFNNLSIFFPAGERFFIHSVKAHKDLIEDPRLASEAKNFYAQEGIHSREHVRYNNMLRAQGYPVDAMERRVERLLRVVTFLLGNRLQLAVTSALEHFTALMAHWLLATPVALRGAHPTMAALWRWHAAEENEHKAVAFDVYRVAGGHYLERVVVMVLATVIFWAKVFEHQVRMMHCDRTLWSWSEWRALYRYTIVDNGMHRLIPLYLSYYRPSFEPWELDNRDLLSQWQAEHAREGHLYEQLG